MRNSFIERSLAGLVSLAKNSILNEEFAAKKRLLQRISPLPKILFLLALLIMTVVSRDIRMVATIYALSLLLAVFSGIGLGFFLKRTWVFIPLFSLFVALPAIFAAVTPGEAIGFGISRQGVLSASLFVARVATSVSLAVLLNLTTRHFALLSGLRSLKIPKIFVMTFGICYRYIFLFLEVIESAYLAMKSRAGGVRVKNAKGRRIVAWNIASLWRKSVEVNEQVYNAMLSRGYTGEPKYYE